MTKEQLLKDIKYYTGLMLSEDSITQIDVEDYIEFEKNSVNYYYNNHSENYHYNDVIDFVLQDKYNYLQQRYNM